MIVVKLGGSLYNSPELKFWLKALAEISQSTPVVIVPGGGPFADQVRIAQQQHQFHDDIAHHMALMAMKQFGLLMTGLEEKCQPFDLKKLISPLSVWLPDDTLLLETELRHSWDITSDSLALWLATKLQAATLFLVKHSNNSTSIEQLMTDGVIDKGFSQLFSQNTIPTQIIHYQGYSDFSKTVADIEPKQALYLS